MEIRALTRIDDRSNFRCGEPDLDRFFQKYAGQNQFRHHIGTTYIAIQSGHILGYATVSPAQLEIDALASSQARSLPKYPLPVLRLARLAVDQTAQGRGIGKALLRYIFGLAMSMSKDYGCVGVIVDAKGAALGFYEGFGFIPLDLLEGQSKARPGFATTMLISIKTIQLAMQDWK